MLVSFVSLNLVKCVCVVGMILAVNICYILENERF